MKTMEYQAPQMSICRLGKDDIVRTSGWEGAEQANSYDKGVEDFFGN